MLKQAIEAGLPLVACRTRDMSNFTMVLQHLTNRIPLKYDANSPPHKGRLYFVDCKGEDRDASWVKLYDTFASQEATLIVVNRRSAPMESFDAGEVPVPKPLLLQLLHVVTDNDSKKAEACMAGLGGCTIKEAAELIKLTMAREHTLSVQGIVHTRKEFFRGGQGLTLVDTEQAFYEPDWDLKKWVEREKEFFLTDIDPRLRPRGLLFDGPPGTGKTSGAKWLALQLGVPLYRLDIGATKSKYIGESESNLVANLAKLDNEEPCVVLFDEVEKIFGTSHHDGGTTVSMLSQILWWLAEHKSKVLTIMTSNNMKSLPPELYRDGRIDDVLTLKGLDQKAAEKFIYNLLQTFEGVEATYTDIKAIVDGTDSLPGTTLRAQAALTKATYQKLKEANLSA